MALGYNTVVTFSDVRLYYFMKEHHGYRRGVEIEVSGNEAGEPTPTGARSGYLVMSPVEARKLGAALIKQADAADAENTAADRTAAYALMGQMGAEAR